MQIPQVKVRLIGSLAAAGYRLKSSISNLVFDLWHGVDTSPSLQLAGQPTGPNADHGRPYRAVNGGLFRRAIRSLPIDFADFTFADYGSGKGKAVLLASRLPFRQVIGIEYVRSLDTIAWLNLHRYRGGKRMARRVHFIHGDAATEAAPPGPLVALFCDPFDDVVMRRVIAHLQASYEATPRPMCLVYIHPVCREVLEEWEGLQLVDRGSRFRTYGIGLTGARGVLASGVEESAGSRTRHMTTTAGS